ncbi:MAG TPA: OmpA family protein [Cyclobacteriaceae bacterium]|nr:OmpA family protein [Cyclobacteriaceae bacterium]
MKKVFTLCLSLVSLTMLSQDVKRCESAEPSYINRMPGFYISDCKNSEYNDVEFIYYVKGNALKINKGGKYYDLYYRMNEGESRKFSEAQIIQNYFNAVVKIKGKALADKKTTLSASINGNEVYIQLHTAANSVDTKSYRIEIIEVTPMNQDIELTLQEAIDKNGKAALYGILFDVGKSDIKPESAEALKQITDYLNANPAIKIIVVGHTDNTGGYAANITLSKARAESVKTYLIKTGKIAATRLLSEGAGQFCPVSTNDTEEGRMLNRRVEIVKL